MPNNIVVSTLPTQTATDVENFFSVGYDLTKPVGQQDRAINLGAALSAALSSSSSSTITLTGQATGSGSGTINVSIPGLESVSASVATLQANAISGASVVGGNLLLQSNSGTLNAGAVVPAFSVGSVTGLASTSAPTFTLTGSGTSYTISVGIPMGQQGPQGEIGPQGSPGATGAEGPQGETGAAGATGPVGPQGAQAFLGTPSGTWNAATNTPSFSNGGVGGTAGQTYIVSVAGSTSLDGNSTWNVSDLITNFGGVWARIPASGSTGAFSSTTIAGNVTTEDDGSGVAGFAWGDGLGNIGAQIDSGGLKAGSGTFTNITATNATFANLNAPLATQTDVFGNTSLKATPTGIVVPGGELLSATTTKFEICNSLNQVGLIFDGANLTIAGNITVLGNVTSGSNIALTFQQQDFDNYDGQNLFSSASIKTCANTTGMRGTSQYNIQFCIGQSRTVGTYGAPPLSTTQPFDNLMLSQTITGVLGLSGTPAFTPIGASLFYPLVATQIASQSTTLVTEKTGYLSNIQNVTVAASGSNYVVSWPSQSGVAAANTIFAGGDTFQMSGFTVATANNANPSNANEFQCFGSTATSITFGGNNGVVALTTNPENGITIAETAWGNFGETVLVSSINEFRAQQLNQRQLLSDATRLNVGCVAGWAVILPEQSPPQAATGYITPTTNYFQRIQSALSQLQAAAASGGNGYPAGTSSVQSIYCAAGGDESGSIWSRAIWREEYAWWINQTIAQIQSTFGATQTAQPFVYSFALSGAQVSDGGVVNNWHPSTAYNQFGYVVNGGNVYQCSVAGTTGTTGPTGTGTNIIDGSAAWNFIAVEPASYDVSPQTQGILELFGCSPATGFGFNYQGKNPNWYCIGPDFAGPDRGDHGTDNGYRLTGCLLAKVRVKVELLGQGFLPCHMLSAAYRSNQILVSCHVPVAPLQVLSPLSYDAPQTFSDLGFAAFDSAGTLTITNAQIVGKTCVLLTVNRTVETGCYVQYGNNAHGGMGMICDSDPWAPALTNYIYNEGNGQLLSDNFPNTPVLAPGGNIFQNNSPLPLYNWLCPGAIPAYPG